MSESGSKENNLNDEQFTNRELLVSPEWLAGHLDDPDLRIVEVTTPGAGYVLGHIRGAVFFNLDEALPGTEVPADKIAATLGQLGLDPDKKVVVYDENGGARAAQAFWLLEYLGFKSVSVLEGGAERWLAEGRPQTRLQPKIEPVTFTPSPSQDLLVGADWVAAHLEDDGVLILDCRTGEEYAEGHIPGARNRTWDKTLTLRAYQQFRGPGELRSELAEVGALDGREVVTYCGSGQRSSHTYLTLRLLGHPVVRNYKGSWDEWQLRADLPKARGRES